MQALSGRPVATDQWDATGVDNAMPHIALTRTADAIVVAPATAHFMAKVAHGLADDLLTTLALARDRTRTALLIAPAMNVEMWENPATQRNAAQLRADGVALLGPAQGAQACGETGYGRMLEPADLLEDIVAFFQPKVLAGKRVLLTAGPTFEADRPGPRHHEPVVGQDWLRAGARGAGMRAPTSCSSRAPPRLSLRAA